jgi:5'(3')-deoxyribonucleotidase
MAVPQKPTIFLDLDGVFVDFIGGIHAVFGRPFDLFRYPYTLDKWNFFEEAAFTFKDAAARCNEEFWVGLSWMYDGQTLMAKIAERTEPTDIMLLSSPMPHLGSFAGKIRWVQTNMPTLSKRCIITETSKGVFARPDAVLIDDRDLNIEEWEAAGGTGILVPRPWNKLHKVFSPSFRAGQYVVDGLGDFFSSRNSELGSNLSPTLAGTLKEWRRNQHVHAQTV